MRKRHILTAFGVAMDGLIGHVFGVAAFAIATGVLGATCAWVYRKELQSTFMIIFGSSRLSFLQSETGVIPLQEAMVRAWDIKEMRELPEFKALARERPQDIYRRLAERIFDGGDPNLSILGVIGDPPLEQTVESLQQYKFSDDLTEMNDIFDDERHYRNLRVLWSDLESSIRQRTPATESEDNGESQ